MFQWLLSKLRPDAPPTAPAPVQTTPVAATPEDGPAHETTAHPDLPILPAHPLSRFNVQTESLRWVFGHPPPNDMSAAEGASASPPVASLAQLVELVERMSLDSGRAADWVPRVPTVLVGLLRSLRDEDATAHSLGTLLEQDVSLLAEALKEANSALYQRPEPITRADEVVSLLGSQGLRMLIVRMSFRPVVGPDAGPLTRAGASRVWTLGDACARASRDLAPGRGVDPFESFVSGLALPVGLLVALRMADRMAHLARPDAHGLGPRRLTLADAPAHPDQTAHELMQLSVLLSHRVAARWELPEQVVGTLTGLTDPLARRRWTRACELLEHALEAARLQALDQAGWLPAPLLACADHLPDDVQAWLAQPPEH